MRGAHDADGHIQMLLERTREIEGDGRVARILLRPQRIPHARGRDIFLRRLLELAPGHHEHAYRRKYRVLDVFRRAGKTLTGIHRTRRVRLTGDLEHIAHQDIRDTQRTHTHRPGLRARRQGIKRRCPLARRVGLHSFGLASELDLHVFARFGPAPEWYLLVALENHAIRK